MPCSRSPGGVYPSMHCRRYPNMPLSRPTPKREIEGDQVQAHTQGGNGGGSGPGPHPRGKWRLIRSRPTPKGEMEGDQVQAHTQGGNGGGSDPSLPPPHCMVGCTLPQSRHPPGSRPPRADTSQEQTPPGADTPLEQIPPPRNGHCCGRYTSYWNAFLFIMMLKDIRNMNAEISRYLHDKQEW